MKLLSWILILFLAACQIKSKDKLTLAKEAVLTKIKESVHDWKSYEEVKWGNLDSSYASVLDDSIYKAASETADNALKECKHAREMANIWVSSYSYYGSIKFNSYMRDAKKYRELAHRNVYIMDSINKNFKPRFRGYTLAHSYRINNSSGHLAIAHDLYYLDTVLKINKVHDASANYYDNPNNMRIGKVEL